MSESDVERAWLEKYELIERMIAEAHAPMMANCKRSYFFF